MYAVFRVAGRQFKAQEQEILEVPALGVRVGETIDVEDVLCVSTEGDVRVGTPTLEGARVSCKVLEHGMGRKVMVFRMKSKKDYRKKVGHRQAYTRIQVEKISL